MRNKVDAPASSEEFNRVYASSIAHWVWGDVRIPKELKALVEAKRPLSSLELGCGLGRFSRYLATQGIAATGVDFASMAIKKAQRLVVHDQNPPTYLVGDVTRLDMLTQPFDVALDVGCFHCLHEEGHRAYAAELYRLLKPGATHLLWALDHAPSDLALSADYITKVFGGHFELVASKFSRRRLIGSHWYWLVRGM